MKLRSLFLIVVLLGCSGAVLLSTLSQVVLELYGFYLVTNHGAKCTTEQLANGTVSGTALSFTPSTVDGPANPFSLTSNNVGDVVSIPRAGTAGATHVTTIASVTDATHAVLTAAAPTAIGSSALVYIGPDDTAGIQNTILSTVNWNFLTGILSPPGGTVISPKGICMINGPFVTGQSGGINAQLYIPESIQIGYGPPIPALWTIKIAGVMGPPGGGYFIAGADMVPSFSGSIWYSPRAGTGTAPALLAQDASSPSTFQQNRVELENIAFRTAYGVQTPITALDFRASGSVFAQRIVTDVAATTNYIQSNSNKPVGYVAGPPISTTGVDYGIRLPVIGNSAEINIKNSMFMGKNNCIEQSEHAYPDDVYIFACLNGINLPNASHGEYATTILAQHVVNVLNVTAPSATSATAPSFTIGLLRTEDDTDASHWTATQYHVNDPNNLLYGHADYVVKLSGSGAPSTFVKNGGTNYTVTNRGPP